MTAIYHDNHVTLYNADCRDMKELSDNSIHCVVTSPPYWGLRKYDGLPDSVWGDYNHHEHQWEDKHPQGYRKSDTNKGVLQSKGTDNRQNLVSSTCSICGAWKGQFGLEPTIEMYVEHTVEILREIKRVLRSDGVCFWNIGDSYAGGGNNRGNNSPLSSMQSSNKGATGQCAEHQKNVIRSKRMPRGTGRWGGGNIRALKPKDLCLIPFHVALAAQADGWWVRSAIVWNKPNPMPESVTDRPTDAYEYIFMFTKSAKYYWDSYACMEKADYDGRKDTFMKPSGKYQESDFMPYAADSMHVNGYERWPNQINGVPVRNMRNVWTFPPQPFVGAHFATFPEELPERCIKAATSEFGVCSQCGKPYARQIEKTGFLNNREPAHCYGNTPTKVDSTGWKPSTRPTDLWRPRCECNADVVPATVLDPFGGSGTTGWVAKRLNRKCIMYEGSQKYCNLITQRNQQQAIGV